MASGRPTPRRSIRQWSFRLRQLAAAQMLHRKRFQIDACEAANVDPPFLGRRTGPPKRQDSASRTKVVASCVRVKGIDAQVIQRSQKPQIRLFDTVDERTAATADRTVAGTHVIQQRIDLEADSPA